MNTITHEAAQPVRDDDYYLECVILHVEGELFKIPRKYCERMFGKVQCNERETVFLCSWIKKLELQSLLAAAYPFLCPSAKLTREHWELALKLSTILRTEDARKIIIKKLGSQLNPMEKISLGQSYFVVDWVLDGLEKLAKRSEPISVEEGEILGSNILARLCRIREKRCCKNKSGTQYDCKAKIRVHFAKELEDAKSIPSSDDMVWQDVDQLELCSTLPRNHMFYLDHIIFLIQNRLFRIPRICFEQADIFRITLTLPAGDGALDGTDDEHPFKLEGVSQDDFQALLKVMYPDYSPLSSSTVSNDEWLATLKLSTMWGFKDIRKLALSELPQRQFGLVKKAAVAWQYEITDWFLDACDGLARREDGPTVAEAQELGLEVTIKLYKIREDAVRPNFSSSHEVWGGGEGSFDRDYKDDIRREFAMELESWVAYQGPTLDQLFHPLSKVADNLCVLRLNLPLTLLECTTEFYFIRCDTATPQYTSAATITDDHTTTMSDFPDLGSEFATAPSSAIDGGDIDFDKAVSAFPDISLDGEGDFPTPHIGGIGGGGFSFGDFGSHDVKVTRDDEFEKFDYQFPDVDVDVPGQPAIPLSSQPTFGAPPPFAPRPQQSNYSSTPILNQPIVEEEPQVIKDWRAQQQSEIAIRDEKSKNARMNTIARAERSIDEFYEDYSKKKERSIRENKDLEAEFLANQSSSLTQGTTWERIAALIELENSQSKTIARAGAGTTDLTRFKEVLLRLKREGSAAPGASGY